VADKPLFRDPVFDGAADPVVVWNSHVRRWWMYYTSRRANAPGLSGVAWVHGTRIGIAESADGAHWSYVGPAGIRVPAAIGGAEPTLWAPDVRVSDDGLAHLFVTVVPGVFENWEHPRTIVHLTSRDMLAWKYESELRLSSDRVIDPCLLRRPEGGWRLWYNNERDRKSIYFADSRDLATWEDRGKCEGVGERPGEAPFVFHWKGAFWMLVDLWKGLGVYRSSDLLHWKAEPYELLGVPGTGPDDDAVGDHPGVVVNAGRCFLFYHCHPATGSADRRRSSLQVTEVFEQDGHLRCDRDAPTRIRLLPPGGPGAGA
jgi:hypothetical protein